MKPLVASSLFTAALVVVSMSPVGLSATPDHTSLGATFDASSVFDESMSSLAKQLVKSLPKGEHTVGVLEPDVAAAADKPLASYVAEQLTSQLFATKKTKVVERRRILRAILEEQQRATSADSAPEGIKNLGKLVSADYLIAGTITDLGEQVRISVRASACATSLVHGTGQVTISKSSIPIKQDPAPPSPGGSPPLGTSSVTSTPVTPVSGTPALSGSQIPPTSPSPPGSVSKELAPLATGIWDVRREGRADGPIVDIVTMRVDGIHLSVAGRGWSGDGDCNGREGWYKFRGIDGSVGVAKFYVGPNGEIHGQVRGSRLNWDFRAVRRP